MKRLSAMVLVYEPMLLHSHWQDFVSRCRTNETLKKQLRAGVKSGEWVAWRTIQIDEQVIGNDSPEVQPKRI